LIGREFFPEVRLQSLTLEFLFKSNVGKVPMLCATVFQQ